MNGHSFPCGMFAGSLRKRLFSEHLGLLDPDNTEEIDITDPVCPWFYEDIWYATAKRNTEYYEDIFHCIPSDKVDTFAKLKKYQEEKPLYATDQTKAEEMLNGIKVIFSEKGFP